MKLEKTDTSINTLNKMINDLSELGFKIDCSSETPQDFSLFVRAVHYALSGRGSIFTNGKEVSATNSLGGDTIRFDSTVAMRKTLLSSGWAQVHSGFWKPRIVEA